MCWAYVTVLNADRAADPPKNFYYSFCGGGGGEEGARVLVISRESIANTCVQFLWQSHLSAPRAPIEHSTSLLTRGCVLYYSTTEIHSHIRSM